jgi:hypothetical protein
MNFATVRKVLSIVEVFVQQLGSLLDEVEEVLQ